MSPRAVKRRLAQHAEKTKESPMAATSTSTKTTRKNVVVAAAAEVIGMNDISSLNSKKFDTLRKTQSKILLARAMKELEQQSEMSGPVKKKRDWKNFHRWVEQTPEEPLRKYCVR